MAVEMNYLVDVSELVSLVAISDTHIIIGYRSLVGSEAPNKLEGIGLGFPCSSARYRHFDFRDPLE